MSRISSNTYFHFTKYNYLLGILQNNFIPHYCTEKVYTTDGAVTELLFPMVCFCDIPFSQITNHLDKYGNYGIGLSREWVVRNKLNPVMYFQPNSILFKQLESLLSSNWESVNALQIEQLYNERDALVYIMMHIKPFEDIIQNGGKNKLIRYYDEREWRYIPSITRLGGDELHLVKKNYSNEQIISKNELLKNYPLVFEPKDIKYIIIEMENERKPILEKIREIKGSKNYSSEEIQLLSSKIITAEQIREDF
jgi:hypothetical protein